jgi:hypothetical protein
MGQEAAEGMASTLGSWMLPKASIAMMAVNCVIFFFEFVCSCVLLILAPEFLLL